MKAIRKRVLALAMALSVIVTALPQGNVSAAVKKPMFNRKNVTVTEGKTVTLKVKNKVKGSTYKWSTDNKKIATVSKKGVVKAVKPGTATVICKVKTPQKKTYTLKCKVKVTAAKSKTVSTQSQLTKALKNKKLTKITLKTKASKTFTIPAGSYKKVKLVVDAPNADVKNSGVFQSIKIKQIKDNTWYEYAVGNQLEVFDKMARIVIAEKANVASISVNQADAVLNVEISGMLGSVSVNQPAEVFLGGEADSVAVAIAKEAKGAAVTSSVPVAVQSAATFALTLKQGAENSSVKVAEDGKDVVVKVENLTSAAVLVTTADGKSVSVGNNQTAEITNGSGNNTSDSDSSGGNTSGGSTSGGNEAGGNNSGDASADEKKLSYDGYELKWSDEFTGTELNRDDWNVELHEKGWVNAEWQEYVDSEENIYVKDGNLILKPVKKGEGEDAVYTSGRVNTQGKHDFTYGLFEVRAKVPEGKGYLPAFWMMPTNENLYGQWPRCGEIDIMEVMGQSNNTLHGTIHYGNPHTQSQGTYVLENGDNFTDNYHVFSCEWEPGSIKWYVDGVLYHEENDWFSATEGQGELTYPAPFDQPFYMILNLAIGGSWVGYPDENTTYEDQEYAIDYVKAYQKTAGYDDSNVSKPVKDVVLRDPDANGNYVNNADFSVVESLEDKKDWEFMTAEGGEAAAEIKDNSICIDTVNQGSLDYSVQLVQAGIPLEKGATYQVSFDAKATEARTMKVDIKAPDYGYITYMNTIFAELTTENQTFTQEFKMDSKSDANGRLEFNMGAAGSTAGIVISNVSIKKTKAANPDEKEIKTVLSDGNHVYNGSFDEGDKRLGYWEITNAKNAAVSVTDLADGRRLKVTAADGNAEDVIVAQSDLALASEGKAYALSFDAQADAPRTMKVVVGGNEYNVPLTDTKQTYEFKIDKEVSLTDKNIAFYMGGQGSIYLDNVRLVEDALIKNGSFNAGTAGFEVFTDASASATYVVDSLNEDNALDFNIKNTSDAEWKIQLKQSNVTLEQGEWYTLSFDIKSSMDRTFQYSIQRDGSKHKTADGAEDWTPYVQDTKKLSAYGEDGAYTTITKTFQMREGTDEGSIFNIALGGGSNTTQHRVCIDNIVLEKATEAEIEAAKPNVEANAEMLKNTDFSSNGENWSTYVHAADGAAADISFAEGKAVYDITGVGTADWNVQLKQTGLSYEQGCTYQVTFKVTSTEARTIKVAFMGTSDAWFGGADISLDKDTEKEVTVNFTMDKDTEVNGILQISMGAIAGENTPTSTITISDISLVKMAEAQ